MERVFNFFKRNIQEIQEGGSAIFLVKAYQLLCRIVLLPIILLIRIARPIIIIRFGELMSGRIGHFAANTEMYLMERDAGMYPEKTIDFFCHGPASNQQLARMWKRKLPIFSFVGDLHWLNKHLPYGDKHCITLPSDRDLQGFFIRTKPYLSFTEEEERIGREALRRMGIPDNAPFVCFHARDNAYLNTTHPKNEWRYHNYRDSNIYTYLPAMDELTSRSYYALRMGAIVERRLITDNPKIIDYATRFRTDFMDIYLCAKCTFFIGSGVGLISIPMLFRKPLVCVNYIPLEYLISWHPNCITIFKKLWLREENRFMTFREIIESGAGRYLHNEDYENNGIELIENTPEEIIDAVSEMDDRLKGKYQPSEEDEDLQKLFWSLFEGSDLNHIFVSRVGANYLRHNKEIIL